MLFIARCVILQGTWRSGSAFALHAKGRGFESHRIHFFSILCYTPFWSYLGRDMPAKTLLPPNNF